ncbi:MAG TPA: sigma-70 family RNA polymerase sigma factor [Chloroflexia bacterium]|nr:sigma-70 family RNA polymerase sigma factor [Chloroflexia bacterium]
MQEHEAVARLKRGDIGGLEALVHRYQEPALHAAFLICRDQALAEDLVQAAFVRVYERIDQFDASRAFAPWFIRSVANDALKAVTRHPFVPLDPARAEEPAPLDESPEAVLAAAETREAVWAALDRLSPPQRAAIVLRYYCDLNDLEVAQQLGCPPGTARRRLHDARQRLRHLLPAWLQPVR